MRPWRVAIGILLALVIGVCGQRSQGADPSPGAGSGEEQVKSAPQKLGAAHLPNAYRITDKVISGGLPEGDAGFQELQDLGVQTIIDVDGVQPDVETARQHGIRTVHLPHGYDGIPEPRARELAKAVRDLPGPIYIHCHHGKHRSPTAAAVACVGAGLIAPSEAPDVLKTVGTNPNYAGLYKAAREAIAYPPETLDALNANFPETADVPPLVEKMVELDNAFDRVKQVAAAEWKAPADHPELDPDQQALLLWEQFEELQRMDEVQQKPEGFRKILADSEGLAKTLQNALASQDADADQTARASLDRLTANCTACHREFRDARMDPMPTPGE